MFVKKSPLSDPLPESPLNAYIVIEGNAAKKIFNSIDSYSERYPFLKGFFVKRVGNLSCITNFKKYSCNVGINLKTGEADDGIAD